jgi:RNA polymerase sigma factor (sigma-70 family)
MKENQLLWQNFLKGNKEALSAIFMLVHDDLYRYGLKLSGNVNLVEDSIQDLFLRLWKNRSNLKPVENIIPYLYKSFRNHIIDNMQLQNPMVSIEMDFEHPFEITYSPEDFLIQEQVSEENRLKIIEALNNLSVRQREAIYLRFFEELDFDTIAVVMDMNIQSVRNTMHRGMQSLRSLMLMQSFLLLTAHPWLNF